MDEADRRREFLSRQRAMADVRLGLEHDEAVLRFGMALFASASVELRLSTLYTVQAGEAVGAVIVIGRCQDALSSWVLAPLTMEIGPLPDEVAV